MLPSSWSRQTAILLENKHLLCVMGSNQFWTISVLPHIYVVMDTITSFAWKKTPQMMKLAALYTMKVGTNLHKRCYNHATNDTKQDHNQ